MDRPLHTRTQSGPTRTRRGLPHPDLPGHPPTPDPRRQHALKVIKVNSWDPQRPPALGSGQYTDSSSETTEIPWRVACMHSPCRQLHVLIFGGALQIFIGSSGEAARSGVLQKIALWVEQAGHTPLKWNDHSAFPAGLSTFAALKRIARQVDGAIFIFAEDDETWYRGTRTAQARDNVILEYGLFVAALGEGHVIICRSGNPKTPSDIFGISCVDVGDRTMIRAEAQVQDWLHALEQPDLDNILLERLASPFQASGKPSLFAKGTDLVRRAQKRVALVAKTPIVLVGPRPYDRSEEPIGYELEQLETYRDLMKASAAGRRADFICVASSAALQEELRQQAGTGLDAVVARNLRQFYDSSQDVRSKLTIRWYRGDSPMTYLVCDDDFMIWLKDRSGENVWITARNEIIARSLYFRAESMGNLVEFDAIMRELKVDHGLW